MPRLNFRLQGYLDLKAKMEDQRKLEYGQALANLKRERDKLDMYETRREETLSEFREGVKKAIDPKQTAIYNNYLTWLVESIELQEGLVRRAEAETERRRIALTEAMKERKIMEKLKEKDHETFIKEEQLKEQKIQDETVSYRYSRA